MQKRRKDMGNQRKGIRCPSQGRSNRLADHKAESSGDSSAAISTDPSLGSQDSGGTKGDICQRAL